ncbi:hypothetical protein CDL12_22906 [Handroanthus impetiginosus]|uniref:Uncharacterized protein n=1 Tax=Handroanthus impetiginosus TaxID=429701 RepID=A0A2G9GGY3_9LAMI|nr:hypothetical protein CDL12_22906 [Handroanthus impetiginosus]
MNAISKIKSFKTNNTYGYRIIQNEQYEQVLSILKGQEYANRLQKTQYQDYSSSETQDDNDDEVYPDSCAESHLNLALLDVNEHSALFSNPDQSRDYSSSETQDDNDDEVYPDSCAESHLNLALLDVNEHSALFSSPDQSSPFSVEDYLKKRWSRSSSLD